MGREPVANRARIQGEVWDLGGEDEETGIDLDECVGSLYPRKSWSSTSRPKLILLGRMAVGLGLSVEERQDLLSQVNDSFWVMRVIGECPTLPRSPNLLNGLGYPPLPDDHDGVSCGAHK